MGKLTQNILNSDPTYQAYKKEYDHLFLSFCTLVCQVHNKKMNLPNIFIVLLKNESLRTVFKQLISVESNYDLCKRFLEYDPTLYKSKYIKNFITDNDITKMI